ncbi:hypothetical protein AB205_0219950, partial [Aquarana catesbeiana]
MSNTILCYQEKNRLIHFLLLQMFLDVVLSQLHYIIPEESIHGTSVGRIAQDLGLDLECYVFSLDKHTGNLKVIGEVDFEQVQMYEIQIDAVDNGDIQLVGHCKVLVTVVDVNDNPPKMTVTSLAVSVPENSPQGTTVAIISVHDQDSDLNGKVSDVNDNAPLFQKLYDTIFIKKNNPLGTHVYTALASDPDIGQNSFVTYSVGDSTVEAIPITSYISVNPENGKVFALVSFDHEQ